MSNPEQGDKPSESLPTVEELTKLSQDLEHKVQEAQKQKEQDIYQKITDRETLISQLAKNEELLQEAQKILGFYQQLGEIGELPEDKKSKAEEMQNLVKRLEEEQEIIDQKIAVISSQPEIKEQLHEKATQDNIHREINNIFERAMTQLDPQIEKLALTIGRMARDKTGYDEWFNKYKGERDNAFQEIIKMIQTALAKVGSKSKLYEWLYQLKNDIDIHFIQKLKDKREELGFFQGKEKRVIDIILSNESAFNKWNEKQGEVNKMKNLLNKLDEKVNELSNQYKDIILKGWGFENEIIKLSGKSSSNETPSHLHFLFNRRIEYLAGFEQHERGEVVVNRGGHKGWYDAMLHNPKNTNLRRLSERITEGAGGLSLVYNNPGGKEQKT